MILGDLRINGVIRLWLDNINAAKNTELSYLQAMQQYTEFTNMTPDELLYEAEQEILSGMLTRQRKLKGYLISFRKSLQDKGLSDLTVQTRLAAVKSFYESYDIPVPKLKGERRRAITKDCNNGVPDKADLQECLKVCDPLERAVMLTGISSGLASNEIRALKLKDFKAGYDSETKIVTLHITRQKTNTRFITFLSPECSKVILDYLAFRDREAKAEGQKRKNQLEKQRTTEESYLFIVRSVPDEYIETHNEELRKLSENSIIKMYRSISTKARKNTESGAYNAIRSHCMRKYYNSTLINSGCDSFFCEFTLGHTLDGTRRAYFQASPEKLREQYIKYAPYLTIEKGSDVATSPEYQKIVRENDVLRAETARHIVERKEIASVEIRLKRMAERQLKSDFLNIDIAMKSGTITEEDGELQKEILKIGFKIDTGELSEAEGDEQIEKLLNS